MATTKINISAGAVRDIRFGALGSERSLGPTFQGCTINLTQPTDIPIRTDQSRTPIALLPGNDGSVTVETSLAEQTIANLAVTVGLTPLADANAKTLDVSLQNVGYEGSLVVTGPAPLGRLRQYRLPRAVARTSGAIQTFVPDSQEGMPVMFSGLEQGDKIMSVEDYHAFWGSRVLPDIYLDKDTAIASGGVALPTVAASDDDDATGTIKYSVAVINVDSEDDFGIGFDQGTTPKYKGTNTPGNAADRKPTATGSFAVLYTAYDTKGKLDTRQFNFFIR